ncbi:hypothetical protein HDV63DRAFT_386628 [Trichoderma sp. SZMC 28014]
MLTSVCFKSLSAVVFVITISRYTPDLALTDGHLRYNIANIMHLGSLSFVILTSKTQVRSYIVIFRMITSCGH